MSYEHVHQGVMGYPYIGGRDYYCGPVSRPFYDGTDVIGRGILMQRRSPYIPSDLHDEKVGNKRDSVPVEISCFHDYDQEVALSLLYCLKIKIKITNSDEHKEK